MPVFTVILLGGSIGVEYIHIPDRERCDWIRQRVEVPKPYQYTIEEKTMILDRMIWSDSFERFVASKYPSEKRFGLEGGESLIPGMKALVSANLLSTCTISSCNACPTNCRHILLLRLIAPSSTVSSPSLWVCPIVVA
jgi:hypothetical protein